MRITRMVGGLTVTAALGLSLLVLATLVLSPVTANASSSTQTSSTLSTLAARTAHTAATPAGDPIEESHECRDVNGDVSGTQGIFCSDLYLELTPSSWVTWAVGEFICQSFAGAEVQCAGIHGFSEVCIANGPCARGSGVCGRFGGNPCQKGRVTITSPMLPVAFGSCATVFGEAGDKIVLPGSGMTVGGGIEAESNEVLVSCT